MYKTVCTRCQNPAAGKVSLSMVLRILCCLSVAQSLCCVSHRLILLLHYYFGWSKSKNDIEVNRAGQMFCLGHIYPSKSQSQSCFCPADLKLVSKTAGKMLKLAWNEGRWRHFKGEKNKLFSCQYCWTSWQSADTHGREEKVAGSFVLIFVNTSIPSTWSDPWLLHLEAYRPISQMYIGEI